MGGCVRDLSRWLVFCVVFCVVLCCVQERYEKEMAKYKPKA